MVQGTSQAELNGCRCRHVVAVQPERGKELHATGGGAIVVARPVGPVLRQHLPCVVSPLGGPVSGPGKTTTPYLQEKGGVPVDDGEVEGDGEAVVCEVSVKPKRMVVCDGRGGGEWWWVGESDDG
ncbi:hypothetical protein L1987_14897 [Smallanthus sonchifolius]|uniref:Uncharacterized protein n=1 Tax=Smallanthus sonchifolius TaxID=185202 RepID=A0ACB9J6A8_9ASTR|nr:hypothetical protein L1987_14897 [Smallanthus sonchifolius]